jgi:hypothetical protein
MQPTKPFLYTLPSVAVLGAIAIGFGNARLASANEAYPLTTPLTAEMSEFFGLDPAFARPSIEQLVQCGSTPSCAHSDSVQIRFRNATGNIVAAYDGTPAASIEQIHRSTTTPSRGVTVSRTMIRTYTKDGEGRVVMYGTDSLVRMTINVTGHDSSSIVQTNRYSDVRYRMNDTAFVWPMTGMVVNELAASYSTPVGQPMRLASHSALSFDGTRYARIITTNSLSHRVNLQTKVLETAIPDR